jgi:hypothetical protein
MVVFDDFQNFHGSDIYEHPGSEQGYPTNHLVTIIGYNDDPGYWICKNSWGTGWGDNGWFKIAYDDCKIEQDTAHLECLPWTQIDIFLNGNEYDNITGEWEDWSDNYGDNAIHMSEGNGECMATYIFDLGVTVINEGMQVGIFFYDLAANPFAGGPGLHIYNWEDNSYTEIDNVGDWNEPPRWAWEIPDYSNDYVNNTTGEVKVRIKNHWDDETFLYKVGVKYSTPASPPPPPEPDLKAWSSPDQLNWSGVEPDSIETGTIYVTNDGDPGSELDWEVEVDETLSWITYKLVNGSYNDLEQGEVAELEVTVKASSQGGDHRNGTITVKNSANYSDKVTFNVDVTTKKGHARPVFFDILEALRARFPLLFAFFNDLPAFQR